MAGWPGTSIPPRYTYISRLLCKSSNLYMQYAYTSLVPYIVYGWIYGAIFSTWKDWWCSMLERISVPCKQLAFTQSFSRTFQLSTCFIVSRSSKMPCAINACCVCMYRLPHEYTVVVCHVISYVRYLARVPRCAVLWVLSNRFVASTIYWLHVVANCATIYSLSAGKWIAITVSQRIWQGAH